MGCCFKICSLGAIGIAAGVDDDDVAVAAASFRPSIERYILSNNII